MLPSILTTILFSLSTIFASRSARLLGSVEANFWRLGLGAVTLGLLARLAGHGLEGAALPVFLLSGLVGFGIGDSAYFHALPHLGPRLTILMVQCLAAPIAAVVEWIWLGTSLTARQIGFAAMILAGVALALAPEKKSGQPVVHGAASGLFFGFVAAAGQGIGAVLSRKGYSIAAHAGQRLDSITAAYQRIIGGMLVAAGFFAWGRFQKRRSGAKDGPARPGLRKVWPWVVANSMSGCVLGVICYQWALKSSGTGLVLPIVATAPIVIIPFSYAIDGGKPSRRSLAGGIIAVAGVAGLTSVS
jgi:drug/metabolite transporter (DMT)-like permease